MKVNKHTLDNGLRVVLVPMQDTQTVTTLILAGAGSKYETKENNGISHFLEHMMFKGTKKRPSTQIISEELDSVGGEYNAFTSKEQTGYWVKVSKQHFDLALDVVSDLYQNALIDQKEIDKERGVILQEAAMYRDMPHRYVWDIFEELMYGDQPAGWDIIGTQENIKRFKREEFVNYFQKMYVPQTTVIVIAGNFEPNSALDMVKKQFEKNKKADKQITKEKTIEQQKKPGLKIYYKETDQTHLILGTRADDMFSPTRYASVILGTILGGGMSSRMFTNVREKYGLTYYIDSAAEQMTDTGYLFTRAGVERKNLEKTVKLILEELAKVKAEKVSDKELNKAKEYIKGKTLMSLESSSSVANFFGDQELFKNEIKLPTEIFEKFDMVTPDDVQKVAQDIFVNDKLNLAVIGPIKDEAKIANLLTF